MDRNSTVGEAARTRAEHKVVLCCARTRLDHKASQRVRALLRQELDWTYLFGAAADQGVMPLLYSHLNATWPHDVPPDWMATMQEYCRQVSGHNLYLTAELLKLLRAFDAEGILAIPFKGPVLASLVYGNLALRQFLDLDIVVRQRDIPLAQKLLLAHGYRPHWDLTAMRGGASARVPGQYPYVSAVTKTVVELHTERTLRYYPIPLELEHVAERLQRVSLGGQQVLSFPPEDMLPMLCVHATKHFWRRLVWICDIAEMSQIPSRVNWDQAIERARQLGAERMLLLGLYLANDVLQAALPEEIGRRLKASPTIRALTVQVRGQLFRQAHELLGIVQRFLFRLRTRERLGDGLRYCLRLGTTPTEDDWSFVSLPESLSGLYSALRPLRLARKYGLGVLGRRPAIDLANFLPTPPEVVEKMLCLAEVGPTDVVYDLGCGDGRVPILAALRYGARGVGVEVDPQGFAEARANARRQGVQHLVTFRRQDAKSVDLSEATVVTLYLSVVGNAMLRQRLQTQLRPGTRVVSRDSNMPGWLPEKTQKIEDARGVGTTLYLWRMGSSLLRSSSEQQVNGLGVSPAVAAGQ